MSEGSSLVPISCDFYRPEVAVTTFQLSLAAGGRQLGRSQLPPVPILVKGCERRFAIEDCETIRLCTPSYYREDGQSLIWDMQEGVVATSPQVEERWDDPADLEEQRRSNGEMARRDPLAQATGRIAATSLRVRESEQSSLIYGDNCLIWCSSIKPRNSKQWSLWRDTLESSYDHISTVRDPHTFAHRCESQLQSPPYPRRLSLNPSPPRPSLVPTAETGLSQFQFPQPDRCGEDAPKTRVRLRSTAPALLLQSPVQRAGRAGRPSETSPNASGHDSREGRLVLTLTSYIRRASLLGFEFCQRRRRPHHRPVRPCRATRRVIELGRTCVAIRLGWPTRAPVCGATRLLIMRLVTRT